MGKYCIDHSVELLVSSSGSTHPSLLT